MERYHDFQIKDHYYWTPEAPKPEPQATKPAKVEKPRYKSWTVREADGSVSYYDAQINSKPVVMPGGIMV